jgi:DNA-binding NarL/FixJ family response regulator
MPIRVAAIEDHPLMLKAILQELKDHPDIQVVGSAGHGAEMQRLVRETTPDVVVLDLGMSGGAFEPISAVKTLFEAHPHVQVLVLTGYDDGAWIRELIAAGVRGYVLKSDDLSLNLPDGVRAVHAGKRFYSPTAAEKYFDCKETALCAQKLVVLKLAAQGLSNKRIGQELDLAEKTIRNLLSTVYGKLSVKAEEGVNSRVAAINKARDLGLLEEYGR